MQTVGWTINTLFKEFLNNKQYWNNFIGVKDKEFKIPNVYTYLTTEVRENNKLYIELYFIDVNSDIPLTTKYFLKDSMSSVNILKNIRKEVPNFPAIDLGHMNSFIKSLSMTQITDEYMRAMLMNRMYMNSQKSLAREAFTSEAVNKSFAEVPLLFPLKGTMNVLGCIEWLPFRSFYLNTGIMLIDGVYKIMGVSHKLSSEGFDSTLEIMYH